MYARRLGDADQIGRNVKGERYAVVAGHNWSVFLRFEGGIGLSTLFGAMVGFAPLTAGGALLMLLSLLLAAEPVMRREATA